MTTFLAVFLAVLAALLVYRFLMSLLQNRGFRRDSTDAASGMRSGLTIFTDNATGIQYVGAIDFGLALRVDQNGQPYAPKRQ